MKPIRLICLVILAMLLTTSCVAAVVGGVRGDYDNEIRTPRTAEQETQSQMCAVIFLVIIVVVAFLARGGGLRELVFSVIGLAIAACVILA